MKIILSKSNNPYYNLSLEETLLKDESFKDNILLLYVNHNTIVIGRNQNMWEEIDEKYVQENHISLIRRISGGGAVYQDEGNLNFSFITAQKGTYQEFLEPVILFLNSLGLEAKFEGKNDISVNGFKVSGNAQYRYKNRMFHHGTLLFKSNLATLAKALKPSPLKLASKSIKSARARVSNIYDLLDKKMSSREFRESFIDFFTQKWDAQRIELNNYQNKKIFQLEKIRMSKEWNYGKNPKFNLKNARRYTGGTITLQADIEDNKIISIILSGDFLSSNDFESIYSKFEGIEYLPENIKTILDSQNDFELYFGKIKKEEILALFFPSK